MRVTRNRQSGAGLELLHAWPGWRRTMLAGLAALLAGLPGMPTVAADEETRRIRFSAPVTIAADGRATVGPLKDVSGVLSQAVSAHLATMSFVPARRDGAAIASRMQVHGAAVLVPAGPDVYELQLQHLAVHPELLESRPPDYPVTQLRAGVEGAVELLVRIGDDGRVVDSRTVSSTHPDFERAARSAVRGWQFAPPVAGGETQVGVPFWFRDARLATGRPKFTCEIAAGVAHLPGQGGCIDLFQITGLRVRR